MIRPHWHSALFTAACGVMGLALLSGCATRQAGLSASDETARYLNGARGRYVIPGPAGDPWGPYIREASGRFDMPETWIRSLMRQESGGNLYRNGRLITSSAGAMGLMQVMPGTYRELRARHNLGADPFEPRDNILAGVAYMREMYDMYGAPGFLAAYNAGPNRLDDYLANQRGLPDETRKYVASIGPSLRHATPRVRSPAEQFAMNQLPLHIPPGPRYGYGSAPPPSIQVASAAPAYVPVATPVYAPVVQQQPLPRAVAWAEPPRPVYTPVQAPVAVAYAAPVPAPRAVAWAEPPRPVYTPAQAPVQRTVVIRVEEPAPVSRVRVASAAQRIVPQRMTLAMTPNAPAHKRGGFHLISSAVAAESVPARRPQRAYAIPASYVKPAASHGRAAQTQKVTWKLHANGPAQTASTCHKTTRGKTVCGPSRL